MAEIEVKGTKIILIDDSLAGLYFCSISPEQHSVAEQIAVELERHLSGEIVEPL